MNEFDVKVSEATGGYIVHCEGVPHVTTSREGVGKIIKGLCDDFFGESRVKEGGGDE